MMDTRFYWGHDRRANREVTTQLPNCSALGSAALVAWHLLCDIANYTVITIAEQTCLALGEPSSPEQASR